EKAAEAEAAASTLARQASADSENGRTKTPGPSPGKPVSPTEAAAQRKRTGTVEAIQAEPAQPSTAGRPALASKSPTAERERAPARGPAAAQGGRPTSQTGKPQAADPGGVPAPILRALRTPEEKRTDAQRKALFEYYEWVTPELEAMAIRVAKLEAAFG